MMYGRGFDEVGYCFGRGVGYMHGGIGMLIMGILFILAIIAVVIFIRRSRILKPSNAAMDELKLRLVRGEITEEEYLTKKKLLD